MRLGRRSSSEKFSGFLEHGTSLSGEIQFSGTLHINCSIRGSITTSDVLIIGERATVQADIRAGEVVIHGTVFGNVACDRRLEICSTGRLRGDVRTPQFIIQEGGTFEGFSCTPTDSKSEQALTEDAETQAALSVTP